MNRKVKIAAIAIGLAAVAGLMASYEPWLEYRHQRAMEEAARRDLAQARGELAEHLKLDAKYSTSAGREEEARNRGYRRPGEVPLEQIR